LRQRVLSNQIGLFCPLAPSSEVSSSKVGVFPLVQNFETIYQPLRRVLVCILRSGNTLRLQIAILLFSCLSLSALPDTHFVFPHRNSQ